MSHVLQAALRYAELGYPVFPCAAALNPAPLTQHGFQDASLDPDQIEAWWNEFPSACIGLATAGLLVVDIDGPGNLWLAGDHERALSLAAAPTSRTPGGGRHHVFRRPAGKSWRCTVGRLAERVDTRTEGGYIVAPPSLRPDGAYRWVEGCELDTPVARLPAPPPWLVAELDKLAATSPTIAQAASGGGESNKIPSGQRNATLARLAGTMRRVGMSREEIAAALAKANQARCVPPLSPAEVERIATSVARYEPDQVATALVEDHFGQMFGEPPAPHVGEQISTVPDPGRMPAEMLRVPGFVSAVMDHCLETAPYPNSALAFCGALALQAVLAGRKVRDQGDNRTNLYLLALAYSSVGKDWPRKVNTVVLHRVGLVESLGEKFASGEGIQDALFRSQAMLFQTDEFDGLLQAINKARDARHEGIMSTLLTMYSAANSVYPMRRRAGKDSCGVIDQPCLVVYGTAIPTYYYGALSERMLTNGFFARMLIVESGRRSAGKEAGIINPPPRVLDTARWWAEFQPGTGNLQNFHPLPRIVEATPEARSLLIESRRASEAEYAAAEARSDAVGTTVWGRVPEQIRKLALLYAVSVSHESPRIDLAAARWATDFILHQTRRMLFMAHNNVAENPFHGECLRLLNKLRESPDGQLPHSVLLKRMKVDTKTFQELITTLEQQGDLATVVRATAGRPHRTYQIIAAERVEKEGGEIGLEREGSSSQATGVAVKEGEGGGKK